MTKSITRRMLVAGALVGTLLATLPGRAEFVTLAVVSTNVDGGFASVNPIAARFTLGLDATTSTGALKDGTGTAVASVTRRISSGSGPDGDSLVLTPTLAALDERKSPYTVTFTAVQSVVGTDTPQTVEVVRNFYLDLRKPSSAITTPSSPGVPRVVAPGETLTVAGYAYDDFNYDTIGGVLTPRTANRSGLASVEIKLYKLNPGVRSFGSVNLTTTPPTVTPPVIQPSQEVTALKHNAALSACTRTPCVADEKAWTANVAGLERGSWTLQAVSIDKAGNRSAVSETSFIIA